MTEDATHAREERVLLVANTSKDAALTRQVLDQNGISCFVCKTFTQLIEELSQGVGVLHLAEESLDGDRGIALKRWLTQQPTWSDLPILLFTRTADSPKVQQLMVALGNVTVVERPTRIASMVSVTRAALRARSRQYEARDHLLELQQVATALRTSELRFRTLVEQVKDYAIFMTDRRGLATSWNEGVEGVLGFDEQEFIGVDISESIFTPEDIARGVPELELLEAATTGTANNDRWMRRKDGTRFWASGITTALFDSLDQHIGFTKVMRDLTDRKEAEDGLKEADRRKDEFLATLAHELRNPLAPIRNSLNILRMTSSNDPTSDRVYEMMERQVNHMVRLVDDLLEISRITRGKIELRKEPVELASIIRSAIETSRPLIEAARHQLAVSLPPDRVLVDGDAVRLSQIIANLLNNSAKYTDEGGQIWLTARREGDEVLISVRDNGIGISDEMLANVFDMFTQVDRLSGRSQGGLGIGLTLVRSLVEMHGGSISVKSEGEGRGTEFMVRLPTSTQKVPIEEQAVTAPVSAPVMQKVLVVDDNRDSAISLAMLLKFLGAQVEVVHDGPSALSCMHRFRPAVVLLDLGMAGMDGIEVAKRIRAQPEFNDTLLIALTGWGQDEDRRRTHDAGFNHHLVKPADIQSLQSLLASPSTDS